MPRTRIDLKGIMTDLPPENMPQGACQEMVNLRFIDNAWRPVGTKQIEWHFDVSYISEYYKHIVDNDEVTIVVVYGNVYFLSKNNTTGIYSWQPIISSVIINAKFASFNKTLLIVDTANNDIYVSTFSKTGGVISYSTAVRWDITIPTVLFSTIDTNVKSKYFVSLEDNKASVKYAFNGLKEEAAKEGKITNMVFVRYALKMYDGSYVYHSQVRYVTGYINSLPTLSCYSKDTTEPPSTSGFDPNDTVSDKFKLAINTSTISYKIPTSTLNTSAIAKLKTLKQFFVSLDIFISGEIDMFNVDNVEPVKHTVKTTHTDVVIDATSKKYNELFNDITNFYFVKSIPISELSLFDTYMQLLPGVILDQIPKRSSQNYTENADRGTAYSPRNSPSNGAASGYENSQFVHLNILEGGGFSNIETKRTLGINDTSSVLVGNVLKSYNNRVLIGDVKEKLFKGYPTDSYITFNTLASGNLKVKAVIYLDTEDGEKIVIPDNLYYNSAYTGYVLPVFLTHPDIRVTKIRLYHSIDNGSTFPKYREFTFTKHPFLNLSYGVTTDTFRFTDTVNIIGTGGTVGTVPSVSNIVSTPNMVAISQPNNPFVFRSENVNNVGKGSIQKILINSTQMSEGQFGLYPIFIFTKNGIYAMEVGLGEVFAMNIVPIINDDCQGEAINLFSNSLKSDIMVYISKTGVKLLVGKNVTDFTQYVKNDMTGALDFMKLRGIPYYGEVSTLAEIPIYSYAKLTVTIGSFPAGSYLHRASTSVYTPVDKSYFFFTNLDDYSIPLINENSDYNNNDYANNLPARDRFIFADNP